MHGRGLKGRWSWLNDFCLKYGYFKYLHLINVLPSRISFTVLVRVGWNLVWALVEASQVLGKTFGHGSVILIVLFCFTDFMMDR